VRYCRYKKDGIAVQSVTPGFVVSNMSKFRKPNLLGGVCNPDVIAKGSLNAIGQDVHCNPFFMHALIEYVCPPYRQRCVCVCGGAFACAVVRVLTHGVVQLGGEHCPGELHPREDPRHQPGDRDSCPAQEAGCC
jgi:hypothetical protein